MKLLYQTHSPYARKVLVAAYEMGLHETLTVVHHETVGDVVPGVERAAVHAGDAGLEGEPRD